MAARDKNIRTQWMRVEGSDQSDARGPWDRAG